MVEVDSKQGYITLEHKKERLAGNGDVSDEGEEEEKSRDNIFFRVKQIDVHTKGSFYGGISVSQSSIKLCCGLTSTCQLFMQSQQIQVLIFPCSSEATGGGF